MKRSLESRRIRRGLDKWLDDVSEETGREPRWTAVELILLDLISDAIDRKVGLATIADSADDDLKAKTKLMAEVRLTDAHIARLTKDLRVRAAPSSSESQQSRRARRAANARWHPPGATGRLGSVPYRAGGGYGVGE